MLARSIVGLQHSFLSDWSQRTRTDFFLSQTNRRKRRSDYLSYLKSAHTNRFSLRIFVYDKKTVNVRWTYVCSNGICVSMFIFRCTIFDQFALDSTRLQMSNYSVYCKNWIVCTEKTFWSDAGLPSRYFIGYFSDERYCNHQRNIYVKTQFFSLVNVCASYNYLN